MARHRILSCFILSFGICGNVYAQLGNGIKYEFSDYLILNDKLSYEDAKSKCMENERKIAMLNTERSLASVKRLLQGLTSEYPDLRAPMSDYCFYVDMTSIPIWEDGTIVNMSSILDNNATQCGCVTIDLTNNHSLLSSQPCSTLAYFICEKHDTVRENKTASLIDSQSPLFKSTAQTSTQPISVISNGFSLDLVSFLLGLVTLTPFLLFTVIWIMCNCRKVKKEGARALKRCKCLARNSDGPSTPEVVYDVPADTHEADAVHYMSADYESYEVPISSHTNEYVEPGAYEAYDFQTENYYQNN